MKHLYYHYHESFHLPSAAYGTDFLDAVGDLLSLPEVASLSEYRHHLSVSRLQHVMSVAYLSYLLCLENGLCAREAARAALLHDLFYYDRKNRTGAPHFLLYRHPRIARENARCLLTMGLLEEDIIGRHMWPLSPRPRTREGRIVSRMDKYCAMQEFFSSCLRSGRHQA